MARDQVRLLAAGQDGLAHATFAELGRFLSPGDLLVVNTSATLAAAVDGQRPGGRAVVVHFSTRLDNGRWLVELRPPGRATGPVTDAAAGERIALPAGASLVLEAAAGTRLWRARLAAEAAPHAYLAAHGRPISYAYLHRPWPLRDYQTVFARDPGSAEMPSAGRPFSTGLVTGLVTAGIVIAPITLHTGVSSLEAGEPPLPERFTVPAATAELVTLTRAAGRRVIAVGTTVTRALETAADRSAAAGRDGLGPAPAGPSWCSARTGRPGWWTASSPAGTRPARRTWPCSPRWPGRTWWPPPTPRRSGTATCGTSSATAACLSASGRASIVTGPSQAGNRTVILSTYKEIVGEAA